MEETIENKRFPRFPVILHQLYISGNFKKLENKVLDYLLR